MRFKKYVYDRVQYQQMQHYQPYDQSWNASHQILHDKWINCSTNVFQKMKSCALCGIIQLNTQIFNKKNNVYNRFNIHEVGCTPYGIVNYLLSNYTTSNGE